jgi:DNA-binding response OmpR family regulator
MQRMGAILVFDNDRSISDLLTEILSDEGYAVRTTLDGSSAPVGRSEQPPTSKRPARPVLGTRGEQ